MMESVWLCYHSGWYLSNQLTLKEKPGLFNSGFFIHDHIENHDKYDDEQPSKFPGIFNIRFGGLHTFNNIFGMIDL